MRRINASINDEIQRIEHSRNCIINIQSKTLTVNHDIEDVSPMKLLELLWLNKSLLTTSELDLDNKELIITRPLTVDEKSKAIADFKCTESKCIKKIQSYWNRNPDVRVDLKYFLDKANIKIKESKMNLKEIGNIFEHLTNGTNVMVNVNLEFIDYTNIHNEECRISAIGVIKLITEHINNDKEMHGDIHVISSLNGNIVVKGQFETGDPLGGGFFSPTESTILEGYLSLYRRLIMKEQVKKFNESDLLVKALNDIHKKVRDFKIENDLTIGFALSYGSILNAYREGDVDFNEAVKLLRSVKDV